jgi:type IV secretion system protein VirB8
MASGVPSSDLLGYFKDARSWDADNALKARRSQRLAYGVAATAIAVAMSTIAFHVAAPLRTVEPYVIRVDRSLGAVDVVNVVSNTSQVTSDEAVGKYFLSQYVRSRESWVRPAADDLFRAAAVLSVPQEQQRLAIERRQETPTAPVNLYANGETVGVRIRNVSFINPRVAQVRFIKLIQRGTAPDEASDWIATINFRYSDKPATEADRLYNPLGFQVVTYRADPEVAR